MNKVVNDAHKKVSVNPGEFYPITNEDLVVRESNSEIQSNTEKEGNNYASNESGGEAGLLHCIGHEGDYSLVLMVVQGI